MLLTIILAVVVAAAVAAPVAGAVGYHAGGRQIKRVVYAVSNTAAAARRANTASAAIENADIPQLLERFDKIHDVAQRSLLRADRAEETAAETAARQQELEQAIAATFSIQLTGRRA